MVTLICSADWQLGMRRRFFGPDAQSRYSQARLDAIERIGQLAGEVAADAVLVGGDVFDANQVERQVVLRAAELLAAVPTRVLLLPGNHDCLEPGTVWHSSEWERAVPGNVSLLTEQPVHVGGYEIVGAPWRTRRPTADPITGILERLDQAGHRVLVGHGQVDTVAPANDVPPVPLAVLEQALAQGRVDFVMLGDRHSTTEVGATGRIWYPGTPEVTDVDELDPGNVLVVRLGPAQPAVVEKVHVGRWHMVEHVADVDGAAGVDALDAHLAALPDKARTYVRLGVQGSLDAAAMTRLDVLLDQLGEVFAAISRWQRHWDLHLTPDDADLDALGLHGAAQATLADLHARAGTGDATAGRALALLHRLARGVA